MGRYFPGSKRFQYLVAGGLGAGAELRLHPVQRPARVRGRSVLLVNDVGRYGADTVNVQFDAHPSRVQTTCDSDLRDCMNAVLRTSSRTRDAPQEDWWFRLYRESSGRAVREQAS